MSKAIQASCQAGIVLADSLPVTATILSEGVAPSSGVLLMQGQSHFYVAKTSGDLKDVIQSICDILTNVVIVLSSHDGGLGSSQTATIASITAAQALLLAKKEALK
jgi:hypothetical protein